MQPNDLQQYLADEPPLVLPLKIEQHFEILSDQQKRYSHFISRAAIAGTRIGLRQTSLEAEAIFDFVIAIHNSCNGDWSSLAAKAGIEADEVSRLLEYSVQVLGNLGNYKSFGDAKFLPRCSVKTVDAIAALVPEAAKHYEKCKAAIFDHSQQSKMHLGFLDDGHTTTYYPDSDDITKADIEAVNTWMADKNLLPENTRLRKKSDGFEILIASAITSPPTEGTDIGKQTEFTVEDGHLKGKSIKLIFGDYSNEMASIAKNLEHAAENAANENQKNMHLAYAKAFSTGSHNSFKDSQRWWIKDKSPAIECNIGFVETYRDPAGVRGEFEGFVAMVNQERTRAFGELVEASARLVPLLPWSADFEKDKFLAPDFTSLEVLTFNCSGIPAGINIPNFDDIRQNEGFKNVSLGNIMSATNPNEKIPFIKEVDLSLFKKYREPAFEVQVGLHELTGHGCGKLLQETAPGVFNFDNANPPISPVTKKPISTWYKPGETWGSVFGAIAASYEECRAELVAMYLACDFQVLKIFGFGDGTENMDNEAGDVLYASYLGMAKAGLGAVEMWDPKSQKWGQAHSQARFSILKCFIDAGDDFCKLEYTKDDLSDLVISLDRSKILTTGRRAVGDYLQKLHVYKSTADIKAGLELYNHMTNVGLDFWGTKVRDVVLANKQPRKVFVQANTYLDEATGKVTLKNYEPTLESFLQSWADRKL
ncbi:dipeptidyl peptidase III [Beauveria brongniartii RCEF 3172]|uniref:Dipeptidyl peptidase 3 n=1 Tax=Beauveria brongniartii RCEF 3172 TaxID=1081107 RepID=A0A167F213_9HYPO|nr:dipeptidyl peptidase III [Beauveria brongniartii RCEF 3172]